MTICAHTLVKNEENYIWYSIKSVINWVDKILVWDTGSSDKTVEIVNEIKKLYPEKISFLEYGEVSGKDYWKPRNEMLKETKADWILTLDGDEVWWEDSIRKLVKLTQIQSGWKVESVVVKTVNLVGDIYHYQEKEAGQYEIKDKKGHYNLRLFSTKIPGLKARGEHGQEGYFDGWRKSLQERNKVHFLDASYMHFTHLPRTVSEKETEVPKRKSKLKYEIGLSFPLDYYYPEVFFIRRPKIVSSVWKKMAKDYKFRAYFETPFKKIKRRIF